MFYSHSILNYTAFTGEKLYYYNTPYIVERLDARHNVLSTVLEVFIIIYMS